MVAVVVVVVLEVVVVVVVAVVIIITSSSSSSSSSSRSIQASTLNSWVFGGLEGGLDWVSGGLLASAAVTASAGANIRRNCFWAAEEWKGSGDVCLGPGYLDCFTVGLGKVVAFGQCTLLVLGCFFNLKSGLCE